MVDYRREWIKERILTLLDLSVIDNCDLFDDLMKDNDNELDDLLLEFFDNDIYEGQDLKHKVLYVTKTYVDKVFYEEVQVQQLGKSVRQNGAV